MSVTRIASRYAKPLLELADEKKVLKNVYEDMLTFDKICKGNRDFQLMLKSPIIPHVRKGEILKKIFDGKLNALTLMAFDIITKKNREMYLAEIAQEFILLYHQKMGYQEVTVTTTFPLDKTLRKSFESLVKRISGKDPVLKEKVDPELIGGYILRMEDKQIDESISGKLSDIKLKFDKETN